MPLASQRPDLYVVARLLEALWKEGRTMRKTQLQLAAGVNYTVFQKYAELLESRGFIRVVPDDRGGEELELTQKGREALQFLLEGMNRVLGRSGGRDLP